MKKIIASLLAVCLLSLGAVTASAQADVKETKKGKKAQASSPTPKSVVHVVTVTWKAGTTPEQIQAALDGVKKLPEQYKGITHVWVKTIKAQGERTHAFVMEFASEQALKDYTDSDAQKEWYKVYLPIRERSTTFDITN